MDAASGLQPGPEALAHWLPALLQMSSPMLPIGSFSYSQGLEAAAWAGLVHDEVSAGAWIESHWRQSFAVRELPVVLRVAQELAGGVDESEDSLVAVLRTVDSEFLASRDSAQARAEARQVGAALLRWLSILHPQGREHRLAQALMNAQGWASAPTMFALCGCAQGLPAVATRLAWAFSWLENQVQAAVKIVPLGQSAGQRLLIALRSRVFDAPPDEPWSFSPLASVLAMRHERQYTRLFRS